MVTYNTLVENGGSHAIRMGKMDGWTREHSEHSARADRTAGCNLSR